MALAEYRSLSPTAPAPALASTPDLKTNRRIPELDGLRGIAIALVVMRHYIHHPSLVLFGPHWGWMGVNLFFVLSGFLITSILLRLAEGRGGLKAFYARRTLRIFPLYFLILAIYFCASAWVGTPQPGKTVFLYSTFLQAFIPPLVTHLQIVPHPAWVVMGFAVLWSLSVEEYFYVLWAPFVALTRARRPLLFSALVLVLCLTPFIRFFYPDPSGGQELFIAQMDSLAAGCLVGVLWFDRGSEWRSWIERRANRLYLLVAGLLGLAIWIDFATGIAKRNVLAMRIFNASDYTVLWMAWALWLLVTVAVAGNRSAMARLLRHPILGWLGRISFCLYLVHYPIDLALRPYLPHSIALIVALAISLGVSTLSWRYFEGPIAHWKRKRFRYGRQPKPEADTPLAAVGT
jgi:peptidoglycan/LPS O-acetylase OafA/YrhL